MKKLFITCALITTASIAFAQTKQVSATMSMDPNSAPATKPATTATQQAQPAKPSIIEQMATRRAKTYQQQYGLTAEQYQQLYDAEYDFARQEHEIKIGGGQPGPGQQYQMQLARDYKMKAILTPSQYAKYEASTPRPQMPRQEAPAKSTK
jgi:Spy/CpxP family protein refolding chaperone